MTTRDKEPVTRVVQLPDNINQESFDFGHVTQFEPTFFGLCMEVIRANFREAGGFKLDYHPSSPMVHYVKTRNRKGNLWFVLMVSEISDTGERTLQSIVSFLRQNIELDKDAPQLILCINVPHDHPLNRLCQTGLGKFYPNKFEIWQVNSLLVKARSLPESKYRAFLQLALKPRTTSEYPEIVNVQEKRQGVSPGNNQGILVIVLQQELERRADQIRRLEELAQTKDYEIEALKHKEETMKDENQKLEMQVLFAQVIHKGSKKMRFWIGSINLIATILIAIGTNRISNPPIDGPGVIFLITGAVIYLISLALILVAENIQKSVTRADVGEQKKP